MKKPIYFFYTSNERKIIIPIFLTKIEEEKRSSTIELKKTLVA